jgi:transcriptional regulator with XRE-family HTH domain
MTRPASNTSNDATLLNELGERLERERLRRSWSREHLAELSGVSARTLARIEGGASVQVATLLAVLRALGQLDALNAIGAPAGPTPLELATGRRKERKRAPRKAMVTPDAAGWRWGDEQ